MDLQWPESIVTFHKPFDNYYITHKMMTETISVGFIGASGSHTEESLLSTFKSPSLSSLQCQPVPYASLADLVEALTKAQVNYMFVPIENSISGTFHPHVDVIAQGDLYINGEYVHPESHVLWANPGVTIADVKEIRSHPNLLAQCTKFFSVLPKTVTVSQSIDSASVAKTISETKSTNLAGIGSKRAAAIYGLSVLSDKVQDVPNVFTKYVLVGLKPASANMLERHMHPKTSLRLILKNRVGEFAKVVNALSMRDIK
jgi:prephenate dehydratase